MSTIDLNADVGESFGAFSIGDDEGLMTSITSANVAAGFHGGDPSVLRRTIRLAKAHGVAVGAHPSFPDLSGFGRRSMSIPPNEIEDLVLYQLAAVAGVAAAEGVRLRHVKPHGALYNMAAADRAVAEAIVGAVVAFDRSLVLVGLAASPLVEAGRQAGLTVAAEAFADRGYNDDGSLVQRGRPGAVLSDAPRVVARAVRLVEEHVVESAAGRPLAMHADTLCIHGDTPGSAALAAALRRGLEAVGVRVAPVPSR